MKKKYLIAGMHCHSCELLVERNIGTVEGVRAVNVSHRDGTAVVSFDDGIPVDDAAVGRAVRAAGYRLGSGGQRSWVNVDPNAWTEFIFALGIVFILYLAANILGLTSLTATSAAQTGAWVALIIGLTAGISTCAALVGGLVLAVSARHAELHPAASPFQRLRPHLLFNAGRIGGFVLLGGVIGGIGAAIQPSTSLLGALTIIVGLVMISLGLKLTEMFPRIGTLLSLPTGIARRLGMTQDHEYSHWRSALTGALTFFLPCGFTQAMQLAAVASGNALQGALIMGAFAVGTAPGLLGLAGISSVIRGSSARFAFKVIGVLVIVLGLWNVGNGWNLTGIVIPSTAPQKRVDAPSADVRNGKQYFTMSQWAGGYNPESFTVRKGIPLVWTITSTNAYTCASSIVVPSLNIRRDLQPGDNLIEFTPTKAGVIRFSCSMGMYRGTIVVVD